MGTAQKTIQSGGAEPPAAYVTASPTPPTLNINVPGLGGTQGQGPPGISYTPGSQGGSAQGYAGQQGAAQGYSYPTQGASQGYSQGAAQGYTTQGSSAGQVRAPQRLCGHGVASRTPMWVLQHMRVAVHAFAVTCMQDRVWVVDKNKAPCMNHVAA